MATANDIYVSRYTGTKWAESLGVLSITSTGLVGINTSSSGAQLQITASASNVIGVIIKGAASQSSNLLQLQNSSATVIGGVTTLGKFYSGAAPVLTGNFEASLAAIYGFVDAGSRTGSTTCISNHSVATYASDVTSNAYSFRSSPSTAAAAFTLGALTHFYATDTSLGSGSALSNQWGFRCNDFATSNAFAFAGAITSGAGKYNCYMSGTAQNYFAGNVGVGTTPDQVLTLNAVTGNTYINFKTASSTKVFVGISDTADSPIFGMTAGDFGIRVQANDLFLSADSGASGQLVLKSSGNVGIGTTTPTAYLHIKAGTASASTAPIKLTSGALNTTAEAGAIEFLTDDYYGTVTTGAIRRKFVTNTTGRVTGQTAANASIQTHTVGAADATFEVSANVLVTTSSAENFTVTVAYTDEGNTARTLTMPFSTLVGTMVAAINFANGTIPYAGSALHIRTKASTTITLATTGTFTGATYNVQSIIKRI